ncbi:oligosaccharide flippase family protein [uncultured Jannaschia sp.]|uniref:oligosaccharide flippase family protein n=1 Tax=uncultured Jannaschia sp. TaxID=293347 RepID=UPI00262491C5|nr:oligosaccharide flippase family protein [uncultured Jannaschia sp.]
MLRPALTILSGNLGSSALLFARNLTLAALIPVEDYGIAATFALAVAAVEMASAFGLQQQIVQAADGDDPRLMRALQGFQLFRGILAGAVMLALAIPLADFLNVPQVAWAYAVLALVPLLNGVRHLDIHRQNRSGRFGALAAEQTLPALVAFLAIFPLAAWLGDWRVMLVSILIHNTGAALVSQCAAERPFRPAFDRARWGRTLRFGWPILLNAGLLFAVFQGDKLIVGRLEGMVALSTFALAVTITLTPALIVMRSLQTGFLPRLSRRAEAGEIDRPAARLIQLALALGLAGMGVGILAGPIAARWLAGSDYIAVAGLLGPMAILQGLRVAKVGTNIAALATGQTGNAPWSNIPRLAALAVGWWMLEGGASVVVLVWLAALAELAGIAISAAMFRAARPDPIALPWASYAGFLALAAAATGAILATAPPIEA